MTIAKLTLALLLLCSLTLCVASSPSPWFNHSNNQIQLNVELYLSSTCPHCHKADEFFRQLQKKEPWLVINRQVINQDKIALHAFYQRLQQQNSSNFGVPAIFFCDSQWTGFAAAETSGERLIRALNFCRQQIMREGELNAKTVDVLRQQGLANQIQLGAMPRSDATIILLSALTDSLAACSLFFLISLLAILWLHVGQIKTQALVGAIFILAFALVHYLMQTYPSVYYQVNHWLRIPSMIIAVGLFCYLAYNQFCWQNGNKPSYYAVVSLLFFCTAVMVYIYQQGCTVNMGLAFEQWLADKTLSVELRLWYRAAYLIIVVLPSCMFLLCYLFISHRWLRTSQTMLHFAGLLTLVVVGGILLIYPQLLINMAVSILLLISALLVGWRVAKRLG